ncbi:DUF4197 domain-containing protein [Novosphingobium malaysiense]|uniref:DUF4197 domain-containing protein n=1 Tax=Novosphingobium malaysiense TaxID=1348853 RepID=A0A0B1ZR39_9SPHN|nr:DUF4197 domain-containing protein [Novosphingobium malaysiense]KHK91647.1 hypothetical protein LK12_12705 [Novosphingobium malaysiense]
MQDWGSDEFALGRRALLAGLFASGALAVSGCASIEKMSYVEVVQRLLRHSTQRAFARLTEPDGFWDSAVARIDLPVLFGKPGTLAGAVLRSPAFREKLQHELNNLAEDGARKAAPVVAEAVRTISIRDALALIRGGKTAATTFLRQAMGSALVNAMIPELDKAMRLADNPILNQAISALSGVNVSDAAHALALDADNAIWYEIGASEAAIREDPASTNDPVLIAGLKGF